MLRLLFVVTVLAAVPTAAAAATGGHGQPSIHVRFSGTATMTGEIRSLGSKRILVSGLRCAIPARIAVSANRFVIGDPVKITCVNGILRAVKYSPQIDSGATSGKPGSPGQVSTVTASATSTSTATSSSTSNSTSTSTSNVSSGAQSAIYSVHSVELTAGSAVPPTQSATGTISALSADGITVGDLTCSFTPTLYSLVSNVAMIGDRASLSCDATSGRLTGLSGSR